MALLKHEVDTRGLFFKVVACHKLTHFNSRTFLLDFVNVNNKFSAWEDIYSGVPQGSILGPLLFNIFINDIFSFLTTCEMCNYADDNTLYTYSRDFHQVQEYLKKDFEIIENCVYDNYLILNPRKWEFMGFEKTNENEVFTYHKTRLKKTNTKMLGVTTDEHLNFKEHIKIYARVLAESLMHYRECFLSFAINRKKLCQTLLSESSLIIVLLFGCLVLLDLTEKSTNYIRGLYYYVIMITPRAMTNF